MALLLAVGSFSAGSAAAQTSSQSTTQAAPAAPGTGAAGTTATDTATTGTATTGTTTMETAPTTPTTGTGAAVTTPAPMTSDVAATDAGEGRQAQPEGTFLTTELMDNPAQNAQGEDVADVYGFIVDDGGQVTHVILTFGGFLGLGEKDVMVPWEQVTLGHTAEEEPEAVIQVGITEEELDAMPDFMTAAEVRDEQEDARQAADSTASQPVGTAPTGTAPATTTTTQ